nr:MAG TPA: hypothetical protein [Caudoviricetes sp.]
MQKDDEKVCFELTDMGEKIFIHINGRGRQIIELLFSALEKYQKAGILILEAVSMYVSRAETTKTSNLPISGNAKNQNDSESHCRRNIILY